MEIKDLKSVLGFWKLSDLRDVSFMLEINLHGKRKKSDVINIMAEEMSRKSVLERTYLSLSDEEVDCVNRLIDNQISFNNIDSKQLETLRLFGYTYADENGAILSDAFADYFKSVDDNIEKKRKHLANIDKYFTCFANLYGMISIEKAAMLYNRYEKDKMLPDDLEGLFGRVNFCEKDYTFVYGYLTHQVIVMLDEEPGGAIDYYLSNQEGKDYAFLPKQELLKYIDADYFEKTSQYKKVVTMLSLELGLSKRNAEELGKTLAMMAHNGVNFDAVFAELEKYDSAFESMEQANKFVSAYADLVNNTRMWENCGYTPTQMRNTDGNIKVRK